jgi:hypothetical protein
LISIFLAWSRGGILTFGALIRHAVTTTPPTIGHGNFFFFASPGLLIIADCYFSRAFSTAFPFCSAMRRILEI